MEHKGRGVCFLLKNGIQAKWRKDLETFIEKEIETLYIEINSKCGKKIVLGSLYHVPNTNSSSFITQLQSVIDTVKHEKGDKELILCMDHNMELLKCSAHRATKYFLDGLIDREVMPTITHPTRIMQTSATLIDNIFVSSKLHRSFDSVIILSDISDHLPLLVLLKQTKLLNKDPLEFTSINLNARKISEINDSLNNVDWNGILTSENINTSFNSLCDHVKKTMDEIAPL